MELHNDVETLMNAFQTFHSASTALEGTYKRLEKRVMELNVEVAEKNNHLLSILNALPVGVLVTDEAYCITTVNDSVTEIVGEGAIIGMSIKDILHCRQRSFHAGGLTDEALNEKETILLLKSGAKKKTLSVSKTVLSDLSGKRKGYLFVVRDVSEVKRLRESLERNKRLTAMGEMAASIAHQIRNPLGSIELFASLLNETNGSMDSETNYPLEIVKGVRHLNNTLSNLLRFANGSVVCKTEVRLEALIGETLNDFNFISKEREIGLKSECRNAGKTIFLDKELMRQALMNLITNAVDSLEGRDDGNITVRSWFDSDTAHITVSDNGSGIPGENIERIFDPFFSRRTRGTGLGLSVVSNVVNAHLGFIDVESKRGEGSTFEITIPQKPDEGCAPI